MQRPGVPPCVSPHAHIPPPVGHRLLASDGHRVTTGKRITASWTAAGTPRGGEGSGQIAGPPVISIYARPAHFTKPNEPYINGEAEAVRHAESLESGAD